MKYRINRTSDFFPAERPCSRASLAGSDQWGNPIWSIEVDTIKDLQDIIRETGHPVIVDNDSIEIYDDYRE